MSSAIIPLNALGRQKSAQTGGCSAQGCGSGGGQAADGLAPDIWQRVKDHPCYSDEAHHYFARMHVAVAPACNIQCNYCNRKFDCANESRPGVTSERLSPEQAARKVVAVASRVPQLSVLGVAGPGDALYDARRTFETFDRVAEVLPDLTFCLSTNGLALPDWVDEIAARRIGHVTVTVNMVDPEVGARIYPWIFHGHRRWTGLDAARILHERQMEGLERLAAKGVLVKVNSVMIPGVNDDHLVEVNRWIRERGAFLHNVVPLISDPGHGTRFGLDGQRGPNPAELKGLQDRLDGGVRLMRHCRQCRADAVGLLGEDVSQDVTLDKLPETPVYDPAPRAAYRAVVEREREDRHRAAAAATAGLARSGLPARLVAVCTKGGGRINQHFGHAREFQVYEVDGRGVRMIGHRRADNYCLGGDGDDDRLDDIIAALAGIDTVFAAKIGHCPKRDLAKAGIAVIDSYAHDYVETALADWFQAALPAAFTA
ncbi:MAG: nitrogenase cofactor biosynthesis protein NifB [Magnetospirillum sp.]|nr:nitrogenase cofactor biosynthesis protein NifB [Magnetospirillum sp.]